MRCGRSAHGQGLKTCFGPHAVFPCRQRDFKRYFKFLIGICAEIPDDRAITVAEI
jgi:hypothetical protein